MIASARNKSITDINHQSGVAVVIGAGISGLSAAYYLAKEASIHDLSLNLHILDERATPGGVIGTKHTKDSIFERGPESFVTYKPAACALAAELGISHQIIGANEENRRTYVARNGRLVALPDGFMMFAPTKFSTMATSELFSPFGKLRMAFDLVLPRRVDQSDESLADFVVRRLGQEALDRVADPLIAGIYSGNAGDLSAAATVPQLVELERKYGSVIRGLWNSPNRSERREGSGPRYGMFASFEQGMHTLVDCLMSSLPRDCFRGNCPVKQIRPGYHRKWCVLLESGEAIEADVVVIATPAHITGKLLKDVDADLASMFNRIKYSSALIVNLLFAEKDIKKKIEGFGFVVPSTEKRFLSACSLSSVKFKRRTDKGKVLLRCFAGANRESLKMPDEQIVQLTLDDLQRYLNITAPPLHYDINRHEAVLPQYRVGHRQLITEIDHKLQRHLGLTVCGNAYHGVGIPDCIALGKHASHSMMSWLNSVLK